MARRLAFVLAFCIVTWAATTRAQPVNDPPTAPPHTLAAQDTDVDPPIPHPLFGVATIGGELGGNYAAGATLALLATPFSGVSIGGSAYFAPITSLPDTCVAACNLNPLLFRGMAELRVGNPYVDYARGLAWFGVGAGIEYLDEPRVPPAPSAALSGGGNLRLSPSLWLEFSLRLTWAQIIAAGSSFDGPYFTLGIDTGLRFDFAH